MGFYLRVRDIVASFNETHLMLYHLLTIDNLLFLDAYLLKNMFHFKEASFISFYRSENKENHKT